MEAAGLAVGVAALFSTCVDSFKVMFAAQSFAKDYEVLNTAFQQQRLRFFLWGDRVGLSDHPHTASRPYAHELEHGHIRPTIVRSLQSINHLLRHFKTYEAKYGLKHDPLLSSLDLHSGGMVANARFDAIAKRNQKDKNTATITKWAVFDAAKLKSTVDSLRELIDGLVSISEQAAALVPEPMHSEIHIQAGASETVLETWSWLSRQVDALDLQSSLDTFFTARSKASLQIETVAPAELEETAMLQENSIVHIVASPSPRDSVKSWETYASTSDDDESIQERLLVYEARQDIPSEGDISEHSSWESPWKATPQPSRPSTFGDLYPLTRKIYIQHDDTTTDGNMNIQIFTSSPGRDKGAQEAYYQSIFHLRMHNLWERDFSLRRYCRDSGREVCHMMMRRRRPSPPTTRSTLLDFFTSRSSSFARPPEPDVHDSRPPQSARSSMSSWFKRRSSRSSQVSGRGAESGDESGVEGTADVQSVSATRASSDVIKLEFSNYAHVSLVKRGRRSRKRYTFKWWGQEYAWRRECIERHGKKDRASCSDHAFLLCHNKGKKKNEVLAQIVPIKRDEEALALEAERGGWVPRAEMRILHADIIQSDVDIAE